MDIDIKRLPTGEVYYRFMDVLKYINCNGGTDSKINTAQAAKMIPESMLFRENSRGRNSAIYINRYGIDVFLKSKRNIPNSLKPKILNDFDIYFGDNDNGSFEGFILSIIVDFLNDTFTNVKFEYQKTISTYCCDLLINDKIIIEIDEGHHTTKDNIKKDNQRDIELSALGYHTLRVSSKKSIGVSLSKIFKYYKKIFL